MRPDQLVKAYGETVGLPDLGFSANGSLVLVFGTDEKIYIEADQSQDKIMLHIEAGSIPSSKPQLLKHLLEANIYYTGSGDCVLAMGSSSEVIVLLSLTGAELELEHFVGALEKLLEEAFYWRSLILNNNIDLSTEKNEAEPFTNQDSMSWLMA